ncbi:MAG: hypothetical protein AAGC56_03580 [Pseudomonadota bacterium]
MAAIATSRFHHAPERDLSRSPATQGGWTSLPLRALAILADFTVFAVTASMSVALLAAAAFAAPVAFLFSWFANIAAPRNAGAGWTTHDEPAAS